MITSEGSDDAALRAGLDDLLRHGNPPVVIVTARGREGRAGCLVGFTSQCGIEPPRYAVWRATPSAAITEESVPARGNDRFSTKTKQ